MTKVTLIWTGILFALLWSSASAATKIGLQSAQPFVMAVTRFFIAGIILLLFAHGIYKYRFPQKKEWRQIIIYGMLNVSIYLGLYVLAMQRVSAGLGTMAVGINPVIISFFSMLLFGHKVTQKNVLSLLLCSAGVLIAAYPLFKNSYATVDGIVILLVSMLAYSAGAIYYARKKWSDLHIITINGWQTIFGGLLLLPVALLTYQQQKNNFDFRFWGATLWLAIPVSIGAVQCWMILLKQNAVNAAYWLYLCPVFGFLIASLLLKEPISWYTATGVFLVIGGLYILQASKLRIYKIK
ncbi:MAG: DMT family transporter [Ferruginibacter sp.]